MSGKKGERLQPNQSNASCMVRRALLQLELSGQLLHTSLSYLPQEEELNSINRQPAQVLRLPEHGAELNHLQHLLTESARTKAGSSWDVQPSWRRRASRRWPNRGAAVRGVRGFEGFGGSKCCAKNICGTPWNFGRQQLHDIYLMESHFTPNIPTLSWSRYSGVGHSRETLGLDTPETLWDCRDSALQAWALGMGWALQGEWALQSSGDRGRLWGCTALRKLGQGDSGVGHSRNTLELGTQGTLRGWHSRDEREEKSSGRGEKLSLKSNNPTPRVGKNM